MQGVRFWGTRGSLPVALGAAFGVMIRVGRCAVSMAVMIVIVIVIVIVAHAVGSR